MKNALTKLPIFLAILLIASTAYASFYPSGGGTYRLKSSIGSSDTTINLSSFTEPVSNILYTMSYLNSNIECGTLDPQTTKSEFISFTGITQNSDGSAQLTGVARGLGRSYPYAASTTLASSHSGQSIFILSDAPCLFNQYGVLQNNAIITGNWTAPDPTGNLSVANREYVDGKAFAGIGGATETATGTVQIATGLQTASSTKNGSLGRLVIPSSLSTSTWSASVPVGTIPAIGTIGGKIDSNFISTSTLGVLPIPSVGSGSDGNITFDGTNIYAFAATTTSSVYKLNRSIFANNLTINSGITVDTNGYQIFAAGTVSGAGKFRMDGSVGAAGTVSGGGAGAVATGGFFQTMAGSTGGAAGNNGAAGQTSLVAIGSNGSVGGAGGGSGGLAGTAGVASSSRAWGNLAADVLTGTSATSTGVAVVTPSAGASGGGGGVLSDSGGGGGGGSSGGIVEILGGTISGTWTVEAIGGTGGAGASNGSAGRGGGGGGAGGNGGVCAVFYITNSWSGSCTLSGGSGGAGGTGGSGGGNGSNGNSGSVGVSITSALTTLLR